MILPPVTPVMPIDPTRVYELVSANTEAVKAVLFLLGFIVFAVVSSVLTVRCLAKAKTGLYSEIGGSIAMSVAVLLLSATAQALLHCRDCSSTISYCMPRFRTSARERRKIGLGSP